MKTGELAKQFQVSDTTIRNWLAEFAEYFDPKEARQANIGQDGFIVLATIAELSKAGKGYADIHQQLKDGYRADELEAYTMPVDLIPLKVAADNSKVFAELQIVSAERDRLLAENAEQKQRIDELTAKIQQLERELGRAEGKLEAEQKRRGWFR